MPFQLQRLQQLPDLHHPHCDAQAMHHSLRTQAGKDAETRRLTEAKVTQLDCSLVVHQYVLRLHISVDNASVMNVVKC